MCDLVRHTRESYHTPVFMYVLELVISFETSSTHSLIKATTPTETSTACAQLLGCYTTRHTPFRLLNTIHSTG
jgi:hypothetical protein